MIDYPLVADYSNADWMCSTVNHSTHCTKPNIGRTKKECSYNQRKKLSALSKFTRVENLIFDLQSKFKKTSAQQKPVKVNRINSVRKKILIVKWMEAKTFGQ